MEKVPDKFQNKDGTLNQDALIKSYYELEKKIGSMISVPNESSDESVREKFNRAIGVPENASEYPTNELFDDESLRNKFYDMGLTKTQVEQIYSVAQDYLTPVLSELFNAKKESQEFAQLQKFFGSEEKMHDALRQINVFGEKFLPHDAFETLCATAQGIQSVYKMMQSMEPTIQTEKNISENLSDDDLRRMMNDPKYWRDNDKEYVRKIENGFKKLYKN